VDNVVTYVYAKCGDDRLWKEKALADRKSDNKRKKKKKKNNNNNNKNNVHGHWGPGNINSHESIKFTNKSFTSPLESVCVGNRDNQCKMKH